MPWPTHVQVDLSRIARNLQTVRDQIGPSVGVMAVLKANAYGHGLVPVARHLEASALDAIGVAYLEEGVLLRRAGVRIPILVLGGIVDDQIPAFIETELSRPPSPAKPEPSSAPPPAWMSARCTSSSTPAWGGSACDGPVLPRCCRSAACVHIVVEGIFSHFANADRSDLHHARTWPSASAGAQAGR